VTPLTGCVARYCFVCGSGGNIHFVYDSSGIWYRRSTDNGGTWSSRETLTAFDGAYPAVGSNGQGTVFLAYLHIGEPDSMDIKRSTNDGASWSYPVSVGLQAYDVTPQYDAVIAEYPPFVYWAFTALYDDSILVARSTNNGVTWEPARAVVAPSGLEGFPDTICLVADDSNTLHLAWTDEHTGNDEVYYTRSTDNGASWQGITRLTTSNGSILNWLCARDGMVFVDYSEASRRRSFDDGATWEAESGWPTWDLAALPVLGDGHWIHLLGIDVFPMAGTSVVSYCRSKDAGTTWSDSAVQLSAVDKLRRIPIAIAISGGDVHTLWDDYETGNYEVMYRCGAGLAGVEEAEPAEQKQVAVQARPSVVSTMTTIGYAMPSAGPVAVSIYEMNGRLVKRWSCGSTLQGEHTIAWACQNARGRRVEPGVYFCIVQTPAGTSRCRLVVL
jgi:hypothetical protein